MFLPTKDGIRCDICGSTHRKAFVYYSADCNKVEADTSRNLVSTLPNEDSYDLFEGCYNGLIDRCKKHIRDAKKNTIRCDLCPEYLTGKFGMKRVVVTKVVVDSDQKAEGPLEVQKRCMDFNVCNKCWSGIDKKINRTKESIKKKGDWS